MNRYKVKFRDARGDQLTVSFYAIDITHLHWNLKRFGIEIYWIIG